MALKMSREEWQRCDGLWTDDMKAAAMKDAAAVVDLRQNLERLLNVCENLIIETDDPGTEALAAVYCARQCLENRLLRLQK